jgi:hypothetical protein
MAASASLRDDERDEQGTEEVHQDHVHQSQRHDDGEEEVLEGLLDIVGLVPNAGHHVSQQVQRSTASAASLLSQRSVRRPTTTLRSASLVPIRRPALRTQPLDGGQGDDETRRRTFSLLLDLQTPLAHQVAHGALAHPEHPGRLPCPNVTYFPLGSDVRSFP